MAAPAVEDVVIVPHHHRRHAGEHGQELGTRVEVQVALDEEAHRGPLGRLVEDVTVALVERALRPGAQRRVSLARLVGVELIAPVQQQREGVDGVFVAKPAPHQVALLGHPRHVAVLEPVARDVGEPRALADIGHDVLAPAVEEVVRPLAHRQLEVVREETVAGLGAERPRRHGLAAHRAQRRHGRRGRGRQRPPSRLLRIGDDDERGQAATPSVRAAREQDRPDDGGRVRGVHRRQDEGYGVAVQRSRQDGARRFAAGLRRTLGGRPGRSRARSRADRPCRRFAVGRIGYGSLPSGNRRR